MILNRLAYYPWLVFYGCAYLLNLCTCSHFRGMSVSLKPTTQNVMSDIGVNFRISWRRSFDGTTFCDDSTISSGALIGPSGSLSCQTGCSGNLGTTKFACTDYNVAEDYTTGVGSFVHSFSGAANNVYKFGYSGCAWLALLQGGGCWNVAASINLTPRPDTGIINSSPVTAMQPVIKLQSGCNHTITIPVSDPERDAIRCRFAWSNQSECGGICDAFPGGTLNGDKCKISYTAPDTDGWYAVAVQVEDFLPGEVSPLSSVPLQFLVQLISLPEPCGSEPIFLEPTPGDEACLAAATQYDATIVARSPIASRSITAINTVSPPGMTKSSLQQSAGSATDRYITVSWTPTAAQEGPNIFCFSAVDSSQIQSPQRCVTILAGVQLPAVVTNSQSPTGLIDPKHNTWTIEFDAEFVRPDVSTFVNFYNASDDSLVHQIDVSTHPNVTYPATSSARTLTIVADVPFQEFEEYYILLDSGVARTTFCGAASLSIQDKTFWKVQTDGDSCKAGHNNCSTTADCSDQFGGFTCECKSGYSGDGYYCTDINECSTNQDNCSNNADCTNTQGGFTCVCKPGYRGDGYICTDINECMDNTDNCSSNADCTNNGGGFTCTCRHGYAGNGYTCSDINECTAGTNNCDANADCVNTIGSFTCSCRSGYSGNGVSCTDINECTSGSNNCDTNADCGNTPGSYTCSCRSGYSGNGISCTDINECTSGSNNCDTNADCGNTPGSFTCSCRSGFSGNGVFCSDINECTSGTNRCSNVAECDNTFGSYRCTCNSGFSGNGFICTDINECTTGTHNCSVNGECTNTPGQFSCRCKPGYSADGYTCIDVNECTAGTNNCSNKAECVNVPGAFNCVCLPGYTGDGYSCPDINECTIGSDNCSVHADCRNTDGSFTCTCKSGYQGNGFDCFATLTTINPIGTQAKFPLTLQTDASLPGNLDEIYGRDYQTALADVLRELQNLYQRRLGDEFVGIEVTSIREGGAIIEHAITTRTAAAQEEVFSVAKDLVNKKETINYSVAPSQVKSAVIFYDERNKTITAANVQSLSCELYESLRPCYVTHRCEIVNNVPDCFPIPMSDKVNIGKVSGLIAALPMTAVLVGAILTFLCIVAARRRRKNKKNENGKENKKSSVWTMIYPWYNGTFMITWDNQNENKNSSKSSKFASGKKLQRMDI